MACGRGLSEVMLQGIEFSLGGDMRFNDLKVAHLSGIEAALDISANEPKTIYISHVQCEPQSL